MNGLFRNVNGLAARPWCSPGVVHFCPHQILPPKRAEGLSALTHVNSSFVCVDRHYPVTNLWQLNRTVLEPHCLEGVRVNTVRCERIATGLLLLTVLCQPARSIPAFARKYGLPCSACHEAWPKLNSFGQRFKDEGYQLGNERDAPIYQQPTYWPIAMRITPHWHLESAGRTPVDTSGGVAERTVNTSGFDLTGIDILPGGTLAKNISFLLVPSIDVGSGTIGFESANVRLDNLWGSPWLNFKFGKFEQDLPLSEKRIMALSSVGGAYQLYHFVPPGDANDDASASLGSNQLGIELMGHSEDDHSRFAASLMSSTNGTPGLPLGRSYDAYVHLSQGFLVPRLGLQRVELQP